MKKWYIWVISGLILLYSLGCWYKFALTGCCEKWSDRVCKKELLSNIDTVVSYYFIHDVNSTQVALGSGKWLFYLTESDGNTIADYEGTNDFTDEQLQSILTKASELQNYFKTQNISFAIMVPPNKERVYSEYMSDEYVKTKQCRTEKLVSYLQNNGISIVSPYDELNSNKGLVDLYYHYDSHWNQLGAYIGIREALKLWDIELPELADIEYTSKPLEYHSGAEDDLADMIGLRDNVCNDEIDYEIECENPIDWESLEVDGVPVYLHNAAAPVNGKLLLIGDSYRLAMLPDLKNIYSDICVVHRYDYDNEILQNFKPDYVLLEYAERYSDKLDEIDTLFN